MIITDDKSINRAGLRATLNQVKKTIGLIGDVTVKIVDAKESRLINQRFRRIDQATDVLSFPSGEPINGRRYAGDIMICMPLAVIQARKNGHSPECELKQLLIHGLLHLAGYDHENDQGEMLVLQEELIKKYCMVEEE